MRSLVVKLLHAAGFRNVEEAVDGSAALQRLERSEIGLVMLDINMVPMNGLEFLKRVRTGRADCARDLPVIVLTGAEDDRVLGTALALDCDAFLKKPCTPKEIAEKIQRVMSVGPTIRPSAAYEVLPIPGAMETAGEPAPAEDALVIPEGERRTIPVAVVRAGLILGEDLVTASGHVLLKAGTTLNEAVASRIHDLTDIAGITEVTVIGGA